MTSAPCSIIGPDSVRSVVRPDVSYPDHAALIRAFRQDLYRRVVMRQLQRTLDDGVSQPARLIVEVDEQFARDRAVGERDDPGVAVEPRADDEPGGQTLVDGAHVAHRLPHVLGARLD